MTIHFLSSGSVDYAALDRAGVSPHIRKWYDQSGNHNDATQLVFAKMPKLSPSSIIGDDRSIVFDSVVRGSSLLSVTMSVDKPNMGVMSDVTALAIISSASATQSSGIIGLASPSSHLDLNSVIGDFGSQFALAVQGERNSEELVSAPGSGAEVSPQAIGFSTTPSNVELYAGASLASKMPDLGGSQLGSISIGFTHSLPAAQVEFAALIVKSGSGNHKLDSELRKLASIFGVPGSRCAQWIADGDSRTEGFGSHLLQTYVRQAGAKLLGAPQLVNVGLYGDTMHNRDLRFHRDVQPAYRSSSAISLITNAAGINDLLAGGYDAEETFGSAVDWVKKSLSLGSNVYPFLMTLPPARGITPQQSGELAKYNALVESGSSKYDYGVVDLASDPVVGSEASYASPRTLHSDDGLHWTAAMNELVAVRVAAKLNSLLEQHPCN